jgi:uncharacterized membrane protein
LGAADLGAADFGEWRQGVYSDGRMNKARLEAFTDGVIAVIITIMVLEMKVPHGVALEALVPIVPVFLTYVLSFVYVAIYWNNHHHMFHAVHHVTGGTLWANLHLLFWLSLVPFVTGWMDENHFAPLPVATYGLVLLGAATAYFVLTRVLLRSHATGSLLSRALGADRKGQISLVLYAAAIPLAFARTWISLALYVTVALIWLIPDRRFERLLADDTT